MKVRTSVVAALFLGATFISATQAQQTATDHPPTSRTVTVFAAASLTAAFQAVGNGFEKTRPDMKVQLNFAGSSTLVQQIQQGAPADVFTSAARWV